VILTVLALPAETVFVYLRPQTELRGSWRVVCDGEWVASLDRGGVFALDWMPGRHVIGAGDAVPVGIEVAPDEETFVRLDASQRVGGMALPIFVRVAGPLARPEVRLLRYVKATKIRSALVLREDPRLRTDPRLSSRSRDLLKRRRRQAGQRHAAQADQRERRRFLHSRGRAVHLERWCSGKRASGRKHCRAVESGAVESGRAGGGTPTGPDDPVGPPPANTSTKRTVRNWSWAQRYGLPFRSASDSER
jgi:hypothetical protein